MPIVQLRAGDSRVAPVVCVHPITGAIDAYRPLAAALDWQGPVLAIAAPADADEASYHLDRLARSYCDELAPSSPAILLGWALGGVIAGELAARWSARGGTVAFLGMIDSRAHVPEMRQRPTDRDTLVRFFCHSRALAAEATPPRPPASSEPGAVLAALREAGLAGGIADEVELERQLAVFMALGRAFFLHYEQSSIPTTVHLFESSDAHPSHPKPPTLGWEQVATQVERTFVPGTHFTLLAPRHAPELARAVSQRLPRNLSASPA